MPIPRNSEGFLTRVHPYAPTYVVVLINGRRIYHEAESRIRAFMAENRGNIAAFFVVRGGRTIALPIPV